MFSGDPGSPWDEQVNTLPFPQVNLLTCNIQSSPSSSQSISTTGCKQTTTASSTATCLPGVKAEPGMCITAGSEDISLTESQRYLVQNPQPLTGHFSLSTLRDSDGKKVTFQPDSRHTGGGKLLAGRSLGITEGRKLVQLCLVDSVAQYPSSNQSSSLSPSLSSPPSPDTQQCSSTTQTSSVQQGSVKDEEDGPKRCCLVCGDVASGFHYGVSSCEACKAFFKRTIQGNIDYTCPVANKCEINKRRRKACQACRYQKCVRVGMLKEGVRLDRVRGGRQKYRRFPMEDNQTSGQTSRKVSLEENKVLESLSQCEPDPLASMPDPSLPSSVRNLATLADIYDRELVATIGWAKQVPGFTDLSLNVQMKLLQTSWTEVLTLSLVYKSLPKLGKLNFATDFSLDEVEAANCGMLEFFEKCMIIVERLEQLGITREEFLILKALVLANSNSRVEDPSETSLLPLNETILTSLQDAVNFIRCGDANFHVHRLLLVLPSLRDADMALRTFWSRVRQEGQVPMNKLLIEMLDT